MKKQLFITIGILFSLSTFAQRISLNKSVSVVVPKGLNKITKEQALEHANEKFKDDKTLASFYADIDTANETIYKVGDIIIELKSFDTTFNFEPGHAANLRKEQDGMARRQRNYTSSLKVINGNTVVITNNIVRNTGYCFFFCFNANNTRTINGRLVYPEADKDKVNVILENILNGIKFKD